MSLVGRFFMLVCIVSMVGACASRTVDHDYDPNYDFARLRTFAWLPKSGAPEGLSERRFMNSLERQLQAKGYVLSSGEADFLVSLQMSVRTTTGGSVGAGMSVGIPVGRGYVSIGGGSSRRQVKQEGTLIVDFLDGTTRRLIWKATAAGAVNQKASPEEQQQRADQVIAGILKKFPP